MIDQIAALLQNDDYPNLPFQGRLYLICQVFARGKEGVFLLELKTEFADLTLPWYHGMIIIINFYFGGTRYEGV